MTTVTPFSPQSTNPIELDDIDDRDQDNASECGAERDQPAYLPTPEEIAAACAEIRAGWSHHEFTRRGIGPRRNF
jgi:hypothetical protein